jgi:hypothetical protein
MNDLTSRARRALELTAALTALALALFAGRVLAQRPPQPPSPPGPAARQDAILLTIFLRHDQSRPLPELNAQLDKTGFHERFPPAGVDVVSWYVMMGIGQVVTLRVPPEKLREVNLVVENGAWGAYRTEFYATYDYKPIWDEQRRNKK